MAGNLREVAAARSRSGARRDRAGQQIELPTENPIKFVSWDHSIGRGRFLGHNPRHFYRSSSGTKIMHYYFLHTIYAGAGLIDEYLDSSLKYGYSNTIYLASANHCRHNERHSDVL